MTYRWEHARRTRPGEEILIGTFLDRPTRRILFRWYDPRRYEIWWRVRGDSK